MSEWQPIETAPRIRERVLLYVPTEMGGSYTVQIGQWDDDYKSDDPYPFWRYDGDETSRYSRAHPPTHWMPLPDPPKSQESA